MVCTGRAYVVGGHGAEMSESGYRISVVAMVWVFMEIVPSLYQPGKGPWGGNSPSTAQTRATLKPLFCPAQRPKILTLYLRYIAVKNTCWQKLTALLPRSGPRGRGARKFGDMTL